MKNLNALKNEVVKSVSFDIKMDRQETQSVVLNFDTKLTFEDLLDEDNDSWTMAKINGIRWDCQVHGDDDSLPLEEKTLTIDGVRVYSMHDGYYRGNDWIGYHDVNITNIYVHYANGKVQFNDVNW